MNTPAALAWALFGAFAGLAAAALIYPRIAVQDLTRRIRESESRS
jgi:hypothetical protein